jgi:hypothetical protein
MNGQGHPVDNRDAATDDGGVVQLDNRRGSIQDGALTLRQQCSGFIGLRALFVLTFGKTPTERT